MRIIHSSSSTIPLLYSRQTSIYLQGNVPVTKRSPLPYSLPPQHMLDSGKQTSQFFDSYIDTYGRKRYQLKSLEKYSREHNTNEQPGKKYFTHSTLPEIIKAAPIPAQRAKPQEAEKGGHPLLLRLF